MSSQGSIKARRNLSKLHKWLNVLLSAKIHTSEGYKIKRRNEVRGAVHVKVYDYTYLISEADKNKYFHKMVQSCSQWPMEQCYVPKSVWLRTMDKIFRQQKSCSQQEGMDESGCLALSSSRMKNWLKDNSDDEGNFLSATPGGLQPGKTYLRGADLNEFAAEMKDVPYRLLFPVKKQDGAFTKQNVYLKDVMKGLAEVQPDYYHSIVRQIPGLVGLSADQVVCLVFWHKMQWDCGYEVDLWTAARLVHNEDLCKAVSDLAKILGVGLNPYLARWTEMDCLLGRGAKPADGAKEKRELAGEVPEGHDIRFPKTVVYKRAKRILQEALPDLMNLREDERWSRAAMTRQEYWNKRTQHCVNGAHHMPSGMVDPVPKGMQKTRMVYLETETKSHLYTTKPKICATLSWKMESPKVRAIKAQDTISYLNEDYIMKVVEKNWKHKQVLLDPGTSNRESAGDRIEAMDGDTYVMLDFSAMDKQHSIDSQYEVMEALCDVLCVDEDIRRWMLTATRNQFLRDMDGEIKLVYSLLTGRRMTTFINTILNRVYLEEALEEDMPLAAYHAGDDIVLRVQGIVKARKTLKLALKSRNVFNERKQSIGPSAEFLRCATYGNLTIGYVNRTIASTVCGSWVNKIKLAEATMPSLFSRYSWMLDNRAMIEGFSMPLLFYPMWKRTKMAKALCKKVTGHKVSVDASPVITSDDVITVMRPKMALDIEERDSLPAEGSKVLVNRFQVELGNAALTNKQANELVSTLSKASNMKSMLKGYLTVGVDYERKEVQPAVYRNCEALRKQAWLGVLNKHPLLPAIQNLISASNLVRLVEFTSESSKPEWMDAKTWLFGNKSYGVVAQLGSDYDDMCMLSKVSLGEAGKIMRIKSDRICHT